MIRYAVIADDLTGAGDTGVQFSKAGLATRILLDNWKESSLDGAMVVVAQTDSRAMSPAAAYDAAANAAKRLAAAGVKPLYKKVDSTLRGQIGAELDAMMDVWNIPLALLCPAFPANGRTLVGGYLLVNGELVSRTPIGVDPVTPVKESHIPTLLGKQSKRKVHSLSSHDLDFGKEHLISKIKSFKDVKGCIVVADATSEADLVLLEAAMNEAEPNAVYVGSAGLALPLAIRIGKGIASHKPVLSVVGSVNPVTRQQVKLLLLEGSKFFLLTASEFLAAEAEWQKILAQRSAELAQLLKNGWDVIATTPGSREEVDSLLEDGKRAGLDARSLTARIADRITLVAHNALQEAGEQTVAGMILTGGDIAQSMLNHFGATGINLISEVSPGIPMGTLEGGKAAGVKIVTKAGGFGSQDALVKAAKLLRESK